jgi:hypothetical protein
VCIQVIMVGLVIAFPGMVTGAFDKAEAVDVDKVRIELQGDVPAPGSEAAPGGSAAPGAEPKKDEVDPMQDILRTLKQEPEKK